MNIAFKNFTGGEVASTLVSRYDLSRYSTSVLCMENFLPNLHGDVMRRTGTRFMQALASDAVLIPFSFNSSAKQNFLIILSHKSIQIMTTDGILSNEAIVSPYVYEDLININYAQVGDIVYLAHQKYELSKLVRRQDGQNYVWSLEKVSLNNSLQAPSAPSISFTKVGSADANYTLRYQVVAVDEHGNSSLASDSGSTSSGKHPSDWLVGEKAKITWVAVDKATEYNIYREEAGYFGFVGVSTSTEFFDQNYLADVSDTPKYDWQPFVDNNPGLVSFYQQRMVLASTPKYPQAFYMSRIGDFESFRKSRPLQDDDPIEYHIASGSIDSITWITAFGDLLIGTSGSEYKATGNGNAITAKNIGINAQSYWGSSNLTPLVIGNSILHVQRHGARIRDLFYSLEKDGYAGNDLSIMAPHLFDGYTLRQWAYQQSPNSTVWIVRNDGILLALTYMKEHDIWGWSRHITDGKYRSVVVLSGDNEDILFVIVERFINEEKVFTLERFIPQWKESDTIAEAFFLDCGKTFTFNEPRKIINELEHLEGQVVSVLADGSPIEGLKVIDATIELPYEALKIHVGLNYISTLCPMPIELDMQSGSTLGKVRTYGKCSLLLNASVAGKYGATNDKLYDLPFVPEKWGEHVKPFSGSIDIILGGGADCKQYIWLVQDKPLPFNLVALCINVDLAEY